MDKLIKNKKFVLPTIVIIILLIGLVSFISGLYKPTPTRKTFDLPISQRNYFVGITGYSPVGLPNSQSQQISDFFTNISSHSEVYGVHTTVDHLEVVDLSAQSVKTPLEVVIGISDDIKWKDSASDYITKVTDLIKKYPQIKYLSVGNEINFNFKNGSPELVDFVNAYKQIYGSLKKTFPTLTVYTTFQFETLIGKGYLTGRESNQGWDTFKELEGNMDIIGLTVYPFFDYKTIDSIPDQYFSILRDYSNKPIAITETGWPSSTNISGLTDVGSEDKQTQYLIWLTQELEKERVVFVNWIFFNDVGSKSISEIFSSIGLKSSSGISKKVLQSWEELVTIPKAN
ncbi:MAG: glycosyl hydrolase 53 family protein [Candidatus Dojkabacteria bacterium]